MKGDSREGYLRCLELSEEMPSLIPTNTSWYYNAGDRMKRWGEIGAFWGGFWGLLFGAGIFAIPGIGPVLVAGPLVAWVVAGLRLHHQNHPPRRLHPCHENQPRHQSHHRSGHLTRVPKRLPLLSPLEDPNRIKSNYMGLLRGNPEATSCISN